MLRKDFGPSYSYCSMIGASPAQRQRPWSEPTRIAIPTGDECAVVRPWQMQFEPSSGRFRFSLQAKNCGAGLYTCCYGRGIVRSIHTLEPGVQYRVDTSKAVPTAGWV